MSDSETERKAAVRFGDVVAEVYHGRLSDRANQRACRERIHWICGQAGGDYVLDVGCSQGIVCLLLAREGVRCVGVDTRAEAIGYARAEAAKEPPDVQARLDFREADGGGLEFPDDTFDTVILGEVVEHLVQPERVLAEAARVLKPGGRLVITTPLGVLPDPDHKRTFWFSTFLPLVESFVRTETCAAIPSSAQYIGYVGIAAPPGDSLDSHDTVLDLLRETERSCTLQQTELETRLAEAHERVRERNRWLADGQERLRRQHQGVTRLHYAERARLQGQQQAQRRATQTALATLQQVRDELGIVINSRGWRFLGRVRRFRREFLGGPLSVRIAYVRDITRKALGRPLVVPVPRQLPVERYEAELDAFLERVARHDNDRFVVMFCGTTYIRQERGNRPMRTARILRERGTPVFYSYYQGAPDEPIPPLDDPLLFQSPIGYTTRYLDRIARADLGGKQRIFIASFPHLTCARWLDQLCSLGWITFYESRDDFEEFRKLGLSLWFDKGAEQFVTARADVSYATAGPLRDKLQTYTGEKTVHLSPNAYDTAFLSPENVGRLAPRTGAPVLGYFGYLTDHWFDWEAVLEIARRRPSWQIEIMGDHEPAGLQPPRNVRLLGLCSHAEINQLAQRWRAAIIPFKIGALTRGVDPIKIYEYLALGLPTVSFLMPQIEDYPYTFTVGSVDEFLARAEQAMSMPLDRDVIDRFLSVNRWEDRVDQMLALADAAAGRPDPLRGLAADEGSP